MSTNEFQCEYEPRVLEQAPNGVGCNQPRAAPVGCILMKTDETETVIDHVDSGMILENSTFHTSVQVHIGEDENGNDIVVPQTPPSTSPSLSYTPIKRTRSEPINFRPVEWKNIVDEQKKDELMHEETKETDLMTGTGDQDWSMEKVDELDITPHLRGQVTIKRLKFRTELANINAREQKQPPTRIQIVRLIDLHWRHQSRRTGYIHFTDCFQLIHHPFRSDYARREVNLTRQSWFEALKPHMTKLADENININLTAGSESSISLRAWIMNIQGLKHLLRQPHTQAALKRHGELGQEISHFLSTTVTMNLHLLCIGPQDQPIAYDPIPSRASVSNISAESPHDDDDSSSRASSTGAGGECQVHCILARQDDLYRVHWCDDDGQPMPFGADDNPVTWERCKGINESSEEAVKDFEAGKICPVWLKWRQMKRMQETSAHIKHPHEARRQRPRARSTNREEQKEITPPPKLTSSPPHLTNIIHNATLQMASTTDSILRAPSLVHSSRLQANPQMTTMNQLTHPMEMDELLVKPTQMAVTVPYTHVAPTVDNPIGKIVPSRVSVPLNPPAQTVTDRTPLTLNRVIPMLRCSKCGHAFSNDVTLRSHQQLVHSDPAPSIHPFSDLLSMTLQNQTW